MNGDFIVKRQSTEQTLQKAFELIYGISDNFTENPQKVSSDIYKLTEVFSDLVWKKEYAELIKLKRALEDEVVSEPIKDYSSYNLGKAHALIEFVNLHKNVFELVNLHQKMYEMRNLAEMLKPIELRVLEFLQEQTKTNAFQVKQHFSFESIDYAKNILNKLRSYDLVNEYKEWYTVTMRGEGLINLY